MICLVEFQELLNKYFSVECYSSEEATKLMEFADMDKNGYISFTEYMSLMIALKSFEKYQFV